MIDRTDLDVMIDRVLQAGHACVLRGRAEPVPLSFGAACSGGSGSYRGRRRVRGSGAEDTPDPPPPAIHGTGGPLSEEVARDLAEETAIEEWLRRDRASSPPPAVDVSTAELLTALLSQ